ncbi:MAG: hypothetical protein IIZ94_04750 [Prevotella sp.]|nr:hypothetical protein [Prevotella sp.]
MDKNLMNFNPIANDSLYGVIGQMIKKALYSFQTCIPAIVKEVGENRGYVVVSPAVEQSNIYDESVPWADIKLPVYTPFCKSVLISCPLAVGDTGWIVAGDLDPSLFLSDTSKTAKQGIFTRHEYQFGFFVPCRFGEYELDSGDEGFVVKVGETKIVIKDDEVDIVSSNPLKINAKSVSIESEGNNIEIDGVNFKNHTHTTDVPALTVSNATPASAGPVTTVAQSVTSGGVN